jgi:hypothetical protein
MAVGPHRAHMFTEGQFARKGCAHVEHAHNADILEDEGDHDAPGRSSSTILTCAMNIADFPVIALRIAHVAS